MAIDAYLQIDGIKGESTDSEHKDWIDLLSYSPSIEAGPPASTSAAATAAPVAHQEISITKKVDAASPKLYEALHNGTHIPKVTIELMRAAGGAPVKYMTVEMDQVVISGVSATKPQDKIELPHPAAPIQSQAPAKPLQPGPESFPTETVSFNYGTIKWTYTQQNRADGSAGGNVAGGWDLTANKVS